MKVTLNYSENLHFIASARHFTDIHIDEPASFHGTNLAPSPIEYFLIGTGSCIGNTFVYCLQRHNISFNQLEMIVDGKMQHVDSNNRLRLVKIDMEILIELEEDVTNEEFDLCYQSFEEYCPISHLLTHGISLNIEVKRN